MDKISIFSYKCGKIQNKKTPNMDTLHVSLRCQSRKYSLKYPLLFFSLIYFVFFIYVSKTLRIFLVSICTSRVYLLGSRLLRILWPYHKLSYAAFIAPFCWHKVRKVLPETSFRYWSKRKRPFFQFSDFQSKHSLHKIRDNTGFHWPVFTRIRTESTILSSCGRIRVREKPYPWIFYAITTAKPLNSGNLRVLKKLSFIKMCPPLGGSSTKIVTFEIKHFVRYSRHVHYLGCSLLGGFTVCPCRICKTYIQHFFKAVWSLMFIAIAIIISMIYVIDVIFSQY